MVEREKRQMSNVFEKLRDYCPNGFVYRKDIYKLTGGLISSKTMANLDSRGLGIKTRVKIGKK